jgi:hypothetical protein
MTRRRCEIVARQPKDTRAGRLGIFHGVLRTKGKRVVVLFANPSLVLAAGTNEGTQRFVV